MLNLQEGRNRSYVYYHELTAEDRLLYKERDFTHLKIRVEYSEGGYNYFSGNTNPRGYRVSNTPVSKSGNTESTILLGDNRSSGYYIMIETAKRFNAGRLKLLAERFDPKMPELAKLMIADSKDELIAMVKGEREPVSV